MFCFSVIHSSCTVRGGFFKFWASSLLFLFLKSSHGLQYGASIHFQAVRVLITELKFMRASVITLVRKWRTQ